MSRLPAPIRSALGAAAVALVAAGAAGAQAVTSARTRRAAAARASSAQLRIDLLPGGPAAAAPAVSGATISGQKLSLASYRGDTIVLNFWGSWCAPVPGRGAGARRSWHGSWQPKHVRFVGVDIRDEPDSALAFMQTFNVGYPSLNDPGDEIALEFHSTVPPAAIPTTLIIDRSGRIAARIFGASTYAQLKSLVSEVIGQRA